MCSRSVWCTMDALTLSLVILVLFASLVMFFATADWSERGADTHAAGKGLKADVLRPRSRSIPPLVSRAQAQGYPPVLRQNVAVARLMRMAPSL